MNNNKRIQHWQQVTVFLIVYDVLAVTISYFVALMLRFDFRYSMIPAMYYDAWLKFSPIYAIVSVIIFSLLHLYRSIWRFASFTELKRITLSSIITSAFHIIAITIFFRRMPISYYAGGAIFQFILIAVIRFSYRFILLLRRNNSKNSKRVMIIGAGSAGQMILREMFRSNRIGDKPVCIIDDNKNKWRREIEGVPVVGGRDSIIENVRRYRINKIYIALPSISGHERKEIIDICRETDCDIMSLPGMYQLVRGDVSIRNFKKIDIEDLLGREPQNINNSDVADVLKGKTVLVTGGGGSIGSELCRQLASVNNLKRLIIFDIYENNAHNISLELRDKYPDIEIITLIGSVRNLIKVMHIFEQYRPELVLHAAAHKHVPLMEDSPCEAIKNNVAGTYNAAFAAMIYGCEKFVFISTDKAVNPVNMMGASKRIGEMIIQTFSKKISSGKAEDLAAFLSTSQIDYRPLVPKDIKTEYSAVRFGNVLGSNGSVIPRFREQIEKGGPVTVTDPEVIRYFMTIPEAASLVLAASVLPGEGRIYVLDMGTPVKIDDLARNMITLSGLKPDEDIQIVYTGLRPGEKLYEERLMDEEGLSRTSNELINIGKPITFDEDNFLQKLRILINEAYKDSDKIKEMTADLVDNYHPAGRHGTKEKGDAYEKQMSEIRHKTLMMNR